MNELSAPDRQYILTGTYDNASYEQDSSGVAWQIHAAPSIDDPDSNSISIVRSSFDEDTGRWDSLSDECTVSAGLQLVMTENFYATWGPYLLSTSNETLATQEWVESRLAQLEARIAALES